MDTGYFKAEIAADLSEQARSQRTFLTLCEKYLKDLWGNIERAASLGKNDTTYVIWTSPEDFQAIKEYFELKLKAGGFGYQFSNEDPKKMGIWW